MTITPDIKKHFFLEEGITYLDHGGFGSAPKEVIAAAHAIQEEVEKSPRRFFDREFRPKLWETAALVAPRFSCRAEDMAFVGNATEGINAVLRSLSFAAGDEILVTNLSYGAVVNAASAVAMQNGARLVIAQLRFPDPDTGQCIAAIKSTLTPRTKLAILDHITSSTALLLPIRDMIRACREQGVVVLVDGAHAPAHIALDIPALNADYYVGNLHKWGFALRGCGFLWARPERQKGLMPAVLSWDIQKPFPCSFDWTGTHDPSNILSLPEAFAFIDHYGEDDIRQHNHNLLREGMKILTEKWNVEITTPDSMMGSMALVPLPGGLPFPNSEEGRGKLQESLYDMHKVVAVSCFSHEGHHWIRIAAQIYNDISDFVSLAEAIIRMRRHS